MTPPQKSKAARLVSLLLLPLLLIGQPAEDVYKRQDLMPPGPKRNMMRML